MLHRGDAVNFVYGATNGPYIYSVQAALLVSAIDLIFEIPDRNKFDSPIKELSNKSMTSIAKIWLKAFENYSDSNTNHGSLY